MSSSSESNCRQQKGKQVQESVVEGKTFTVAILTFKRPDELKRCLNKTVAALASASERPFALDEVLVVDNDPARSSEDVTAELSQDLSFPTRYVCEPQPGVANARNRALQECGSDALVFIDDDEIPGAQWPDGLLTAMAETGAALVGGPVDTLFSQPPPDWIKQGRFFARDNPGHLMAQDWLRSGNLAIDMNQVGSASLRFDPKLTVSEDVAFSRAARAAGLKLVWSQHGSVSEYVGPDRFSVSWRLRREYRAQAGWATVTVNLRDQSRPGLRTAVRGLTLILSGAVKLALSAVPPSKAAAVGGLTDIWGGVGRLSGLRQR